MLKSIIHQPTSRYRIFLLAAVLSFFTKNASLQAQIALSAGRSPDARDVAAPREVEASKGTYDRFVLIRWEPAENAGSYRVMRTMNPKSGSLQEVSHSWQKSTWLCDYSAQPGVDYYYAVVASNGAQVSKLSAFDQGFLKKKGPVATEDDQRLAENYETYSAPKPAFLLISGLEADRNAYRAGETAKIELVIQNIFDQATPRTELRFFLSENAVLDWNDRLLLQKSYSSFPADQRLSLPEQVRLPEGLLPGKYYLIAVLSTEGEILQSRTGLLSLDITP